MLCDHSTLHFTHTSNRWRCNCSLSPFRVQPGYDTNLCPWNFTATDHTTQCQQLSMFIIMTTLSFASLFYWFFHSRWRVAHWPASLPVHTTKTSMSSMLLVWIWMLQDKEQSWTVLCAVRMQTSIWCKPKVAIINGYKRNAVKKAWNCSAHKCVLWYSMLTPIQIKLLMWGNILLSILVFEDDSGINLCDTNVPCCLHFDSRVLDCIGPMKII